MTESSTYIGRLQRATIAVKWYWRYIEWTHEGNPNGRLSRR